MAHVVNGKKIADIFSKGKPEPLDSEFDVEDVLSAVKSMRDKIEFYEALKKERSRAIQQEIDKVQDKVEFLEDVITETMENVKKKSIDFPGIGKVTLVSRKGKWVVNDTDEVISYLRDTDLAAYNKVVSQKDVVSKKELDAVLDIWKKTEQVPDCVEKAKPTKSLKIKFQDVVVKEEDETDNSGDRPDRDGLVF